MTLKLDPAEIKRILEEEQARAQRPAPSPAPQPPQQAYVAGVANPENYIVIPNTNIIIAKTQSHSGFNWQDTKNVLAKDGMFMPWPSLFMQYFNAIIYASQGKATLYNGAGRVIDSAETQQLYQYMAGKAAEKPWVWLDAKFEVGNGAGGLDITTSEFTVQGTINTIRQALLPCLLENCFADLDSLNTQGLPIKKSRQQAYSPKDNIYFYKPLNPLNGSVAGFGADAGGVYLNCDGSPRGSNSSLGVFECAPLAPRKT
ncbi:MAG: hypothetical protein HY438_00070 [DPANN group archaeon]|nr:hypothetical protein [DPANN group archaeon]